MKNGNYKINIEKRITRIEVLLWMLFIINGLKGAAELGGIVTAAILP